MIMKNRSKYGNVFGTNITRVQKVLYLCFSFIILGQATTVGQVNPSRATASLLDNSTNSNEYIVSVHFENELLSTVLHKLARKVNVGISYDTQTVPPKLITYQGKNKSIYTVLKATLEGTGLYVTLSENKKVIVIKEKKLEQLPLIQDEITGTVTDAQSGETLPGVNIMIKGTTIGTSTDANGTFDLEVPSLQDTLVVSFIGYQTREVPIDGQTELNIVMEQQAISGDELIVVGYGTQERQDFTGSVSRIEADDYNKQSVSQLTEMLSGTIPGFYSQQSASPAGGGSMEVRGPTSISANTDPMIVLDGVIYNGSLRDINPNDIETIDVLKDASSAAVYGSRAANGVVLVTTKKGSEGEPTISFSSKVGVSTPTKDREPLGPEDYLTFRADYFRETTRNNPTISEYFYNDPDNLPDNLSVDEWLQLNDSPNPDPYTEYLQRLNLYPTEQENALAGKTVDWYDLVMMNGIKQNYDISVSGGLDNLNYYWSVGYLNNEGLIKGDDYSTFRTRLNLEYKINDWLVVGTNTQYSSRDEGDTPASLGLMYIASPFGDVRNEDGSLKLRPYGDPSAYNPLMNYYGHNRERKINSIFSNLYTEITLPFNIEYEFSYQPRLAYTNELNFWGEQTITGTQTYPGGYATRVNSKVSDWMVDNLVTWEEEIGIHAVNLTFLYNIEKKSSLYETQSNQNFAPNANLGYHGLQFGDSPDLNNVDTKETADALMGRLNYTLLDKYILTASIRRDGYSAFGQDQPRAVFPALAGAWRISNEQFYNTDWFVNRLKLRVSWGINGNRSIGAYSALASLSSTLDYDGSNVRVGVENSSLANENLAWEQTTALNFGADIGMLNDRLGISADYYIGTTKDVLMNRRLPIITGFSNVTANLGELKNHGLDISITSNNIIKPTFSWSTDVAFSFNRNEIVSLYGDYGEYTLLGEQRRGELPDFSNNWFPGHAIDAVWNYDITGVWQMEEAEQAAEYNMLPGDYKAEDVNNDGSYVDVEDKQFIGYTKPRFHIGLRNNFNMGPFSANIFIRGDLGHLIPFNEALRGTLSHDRRNYDMGPLPYWTAENKNNEYARLRPKHTAYGGGLNFYEPGTFVRIQDVTLNYSFPQSLLEKFDIATMSIYLSSRNLLTFDDFAGWDPESRMTPMPKTFTVGIDLSL